MPEGIQGIPIGRPDLAVGVQLAREDIGIDEPQARPRKVGAPRARHQEEGRQPEVTRRVAGFLSLSLDLPG
jgi:hypothetical protein